MRAEKISPFSVSLLTWLWCSLTFSQWQPHAGVLAHSHTQPTRIARVLFFLPLNGVTYLLDVNLDQRLTCVRLSRLMLGYQHMSIMESHGPTNHHSRHHGGSHCLPKLMSASWQHTSGLSLITTMVNI
jgi:hypothetical protein